MRTLGILAIIAATATPALAHRDLNEGLTQAGTTTASVTKAAFISVAGSGTVQSSAQDFVAGRER